MNDLVRFESFEVSWWVLFAVLPLAGLYAFGFARKTRALRAFARIETLRVIASTVSRPRQIAKAGLVLLAVAVLAVALWRPQGSPRLETVRQKGRDIVFLLDVSKSMLAKDLAPNRLERAKLMIDDVLSMVKGDRVGLVAFAGTAALKCPLTHNVFAFRNQLRRLDVASVSRGGTNLGDAIRLATRRIFHGEEGTYKDLILITDGDDQDSFPVEAAQEAVREGVRIFTVGLGSPEGVTLSGVEYRGRPVVSGLNEDLLREIAFTHPEGKYLPVRTGTGDLGELYRAAIATAEAREEASRETRIFEEWYQAPVAIALALLAAEWFVSERRREARAAAGSGGAT